MDLHERLARGEACEYAVFGRVREARACKREVPVTSGCMCLRRRVGDDGCALAWDAFGGGDDRRGVVS